MKYETKWIFQKDFLDRNLELHLIDAGARGDLPDPWRYLPESAIRVTGFEPDPSACEELKTRFKNRMYYPHALWSHETNIQIHINRTPSTSSVFATNSQLGDWFEQKHFIGRETERTVTVHAVSLDSLHLSQADFFKIDTQGSELAILKGARELLVKQLPIVIAEAWNIEAYLGAPSAAKIAEYMESIGYFVLDMEITANWRFRAQGRLNLSTKERASGVDLVFVPKLDRLLKLDMASLLKRVAILELFGYRDLAGALLEQSSLLQSDKAKILSRLEENSAREATFLKKLNRRLGKILGKTITDHAPIHD